MQRNKVTIVVENAALNIVKNVEHKCSRKFPIIFSPEDKNNTIR